MDRKRQRQELEAKLARCRELAKEFTCRESVKNLSDLTAEIQQQIRLLDE
jgi:hypothetical protein